MLSYWRSSLADSLHSEGASQECGRETRYWSRWLAHQTEYGDGGYLVGSQQVARATTTWARADIYEKPEISEEKENMPSQSSDDNKEENKDSNVHSDDDKEENKGSYVHSDGVREESKGCYVHLSSSLSVRNQQR